MLPIPLISRGFFCNNSATFPSGVSTPSIWYKAGLTASSNTNGFNTVNSSSEYDWWYDYSGNNRNLTPPYSYSKFDYGTSFTKNDLYYFGCADGESAYMYNNSYGSIPCTAGQGTLICVYRNATNNTNSLWAFSKPSNSLANGYFMDMTTTTILGDNQTYTFANTSGGSQWNVRVVSVSSIGNPLVYRNNGVVGATSSYSHPLASGANAITSFDGYNGVSLAEFMWWQTPISSDNCTEVENYIKERWCITY